MTLIALLRGINVGGRNSVLMVDLRSLCGEIGWRNVRTYIQSGNVVFDADDMPADCEEMFEQAVETRFGLSIPIIVRSTAQWEAYIEGNPFIEAAEEEPNRVMLALPKKTPEPTAASLLQERARDGERVAQADDVLWIHYPAGAGKSKLSPSLIDRLVGSPVTSRNWRTVLKVAGLVGLNAS